MEAPPSHRNNFGALRLIFAMCVLISHSIELVDGNRSREPLTFVFGTLSLGEFGVDGFFLISGYLITQSFENSASSLSYLWKRMLRIYPAFIIAFVISISIVGPLSGADMHALEGKDWLKQIAYMLILAVPRLPNAFSDLPYPALNGSMWTVSYEFRCYILIAVFGMFGILRRRMLFAVLVVILLLASAFLTIRNIAFTPLMILTGYPTETIRLTALFLSGAAFYIFRSTIVYRNDVAVVAAVALFVLLFSHTTEELAMPILGGYLVFWIGFLRTTPKLNQINNSTDISYGMYLYAWPIQNLLIKFVTGISPLTVMSLTTVLAGSTALLSWHLIEKPSLLLKPGVEKRTGSRRIKHVLSSSVPPKTP